MTPSINKVIVRSRPLWDPEPNTFVFREALQMRLGDLNLKRVQLSDFTVIAFKMAVKTKKATCTEVDMFETVFTRGCHVRKTRDHKGHPAFVPDGSTMFLDEEPYPGKSAIVKGPTKWHVNNVHECPGYEAWIKKLLQYRCQLNEDELQSMNNPFPIPIDLTYANMQKYDAHGRWFHGDGTFLDKSMTPDKQKAHYKAFYDKSVDGPATNPGCDTNIAASKPAIDSANNVSRSRPSLDSDLNPYKKLLEENRNLKKRNRDLVENEEHLLQSMHTALRDRTRQLYTDLREVKDWSRLVDEKRQKYDRGDTSLCDGEPVMAGGE